MADIPEKFLAPYDPTATEDRIYTAWEDSDLFNPDTCIDKGFTAPDAEHFSIVLPPPNVTGQLHLGHAFENAIQDTMIRYNRMNGKKTLWIPGTDHAAIATQSKFEKELTKKEKKSRHDFSREEFFGMVHEYALGNQTAILAQLRKLGASLDWSRLAFTLDELRQEAVFEAFKRMYDMGLIYREHRIVNWDIKGQTVISDDEVMYEERTGYLYTFRYAPDFPIPIATTRPETKLGDTAVAVHPDDTRYREYLGQEFSFVFAGEEVTVTIVGDDAVDPEFGTGAVGVTPAHSMTDWEIGERHNLPMKQVINEYGKMMVGGDDIKGTKASVARESIVAWLESEGLLVETKEIQQNVGTAERTGGVIEPLPKLQWWIDTNKPFAYPFDTLPGISKGEEITLKELMIHAVRESHIDIIPNRFEKTYFNWIENLRPWNISRQIIYGHRIPVWYKGDDIEVSVTSPGEGWEQDPDTLDTWFSSGLWTFSTLGWPHTTSDLATYHPTSVIDPGYEILFFWVARMILMSTLLQGEVPFQTVYLHGILRDKQGRKFSKSLNNGIDPLEVIEKYGADALRMSLIVGVGPGSDANFDEQKVKAYKKFANKLWNITRFVLENTSNADTTGALMDAHQKHLETLNALTAEITDYMETYRFYLAGERLYHYIWHEFADVILESCKEDLASGNTEMTTSARVLLRIILDRSIVLLHPFMPFITEEIWGTLHPDAPFLMVTPWSNKN